MRTKAILLLLVLLLSASFLCISTPLPSEELLEEYGVVELTLGFLIVAATIGVPLMAPIFLFKKLW